MGSWQKKRYENGIQERRQAESENKIWSVYNILCYVNRVITLRPERKAKYMRTPIEWAQAACDTMMRKFHAVDLPPKGHFHYHQGVFLSGMMETWKICHDQSYFEYIKAWLDSVFGPDGAILNCSRGELDDIMPGILLFPIKDYTGAIYYEKCINAVYRQYLAIPRTSEGAWWHKPNGPDQMWLDGLYMAGPFVSEYAQRYSRQDMTEDVIHEALLMREKCKDEKTGLYYHAWDGRKTQKWADPVTGRSREFWGRAMGWIPVALLNDLDYIPVDTAGRDRVVEMCTDLLKALCPYQGEDGRWYQVVDKLHEKGNWPENSCTCLYAAGFCKAVRLGYLPEQYAQVAQKGYEGVIRSLTFEGEDLQIGNVCIGTGVGDYDFYIARPVSVNDLHAVGAFLILCTEYQRLLDFLRRD